MLFSAISGTSYNTIASLGAAAAISAIRSPTRGCTIALSRLRASGSLKTIAATLSRSSVPSDRRTSAPNSSLTLASPGVPAATTSCAAWSASTSTAPSATNRRDASLLPEPMPPVSPTRNTCAVSQPTYDLPVPGRNEFSTWFGGTHSVWDISGESEIPFIDLRYFGRVFQQVNEQLPDAGLHVLATDALDGPLPVSGRNVVVLCLNDEFGRSPTYAYDVRLVVKTMGAGKRTPYVAMYPARRWPGPLLVALQEAVVQVRRLPYLSRAAAGTVTHRRRPPVVDVPLGIRAFYHRDLVPFEERAYDVMFAGSLVNEPGEDQRRFPTQKVRFRRDFLAA